jgi:prepilin-type N-terminal cleavage/methylation domain-containing protein
MSLRNRKRAFTLVELLVVIVIISILLAILFPAIQMAREAARRTQCSNKMRQLALALTDVHDRNGYFPSSCRVMKNPANHRIIDIEGWSWVVNLLPNLEQNRLYESLDLAVGPLVRYGTPDAHYEARRTSLPELLCPSSGTKQFAATDISGGSMDEALSNYKVMGATHLESLNFASLNPTVPLYPAPVGKHPDGASYPGSKLNLNNDFKDGTTHTIYLVETKEKVFARWPLGWEMALVGLPTIGEDAVGFDNTFDGKFYHPTGYNGYTGDESTIPRRFHTYLNHDYEKITWYIPAYGNFTGQKYGPSSSHNGVTNHTFVDGSVHSIKNDVDVALYMFLITRDARDPVPERETIEK